MIIKKSTVLLLAVFALHQHSGRGGVSFVNSTVVAAADEGNDSSVLTKDSDGGGEDRSRPRRISKSSGKKKGKKGKKKSDKKNKYDVVVVGSGVSGMVAANELEKAGKDVLVVEAMDRIGGRMVGREVAPNQYVDFGGQYLGETHTHLKELLEELDIEYFVAPTLFQPPKENQPKNQLLYGEGLYEIDGAAVGAPYPYNLVTEQLVAQGLSQSDIEEGTSAFLEFANMANAELPLGGYPTDPDNGKYDITTYGQFVQERVKSDLGRYIAESWARINGADGPSDASETSLLHRMWCQKNFPESQEPQKYLLHGGAGQIPGKLADKLTHPVLTGNPVVSIDQTKSDSGGGAVVRTLTGKEIHATDGVIVAMAPVMANRITFYPPLPASYHQMAQHMPMGTVAKALISYSSPFWLEKGLSGMAFADYTSKNMCTMVADSSDPRSGKGVIIIFIAAQQYDILNAIKGEQERKDAVLNDLSVFLGEEAKDPETFDLADWPAEQFVQGSYAGYMTNLGWTRFGKSLTEQFRMVSWAGTETSDTWPGYFEGGVEAGVRAAKEVMYRTFEHTAQAPQEKMPFEEK